MTATDSSCTRGRGAGIGLAFFFCVTAAADNPEVREDALLTLSDVDAGAVIDIVAGALADPSPLVRDTAAAVLEDVSGAGATDFTDQDRLMQ